MADLQKYRAHESLAVDTAADWQVQTAVTADSDGVAVNVTGYHTVHLQSNNDFYFTFNTTGTDSDIDTNKDLYLKGGDTIYSLKIPTGLGDTLYLIMERKGSSDATVRTILA
tara:strand:- start:49 stop:384 length:336 start_codon:yes stop_codon:yes gene_type:complete